MGASLSVNKARGSSKVDDVAAYGLPKDAGEASLFRLKYASTLLDCTERTVAEIISAALKNNPKLGITGMLYLEPSSAKVVQHLEGPRDSVLTLFEIIKRDKRHRNYSVLDTGFIESRVYADFGMALARVSDGAEEVIANVEQLGVTEHLIRLQYRSRLVAASVDEARQTLQEILHCSVRNNTFRGIGGLLCFNPQTMQVTQLLEGPAGAVQDLFTTIMADSRHSECVLTNQELLLSKREYLFGASWGLMQTETTEVTPLDLDARIRQAFHGTTAQAVMDGKGMDLSEAELHRLVDGAVRGVDSTPIASHMM